VFSGHALQFRINAEDPFTFAPSPGKLTRFHMPGGPGVRVDSHAYGGYTIPHYYDNLIGKIIVSAENRPACLARAARALDELAIEGVKTNAALQNAILEQDNFIRGDYDIHWLEKLVNSRNADVQP
jgi:acetyl-CoA carboxylase, biotin carboxylase subunit